MIAGRAPFEAATTGDMMVAILDRNPAPLARYAPNAPDELEWIVTKALVKDRDDRYQLMKSLLTDLKRLQKRLQLASGFDRTGEVGHGEEIETVEYRYDTTKDSGGTTTGGGVWHG